MNLSHFPQTPHPEQMDAMRVLMSPFPVIRFMNWQQINHYSWGERPRVVDWHQLPQESDDWVYKKGGWHTFDGVPMSVMCDFANSMQARPWFNIPHMASAETMRHMIAFIITNCDQRPILEYSNEVWNNMFQQCQEVTDMGYEHHNCQHDAEARFTFQAEQTKIMSEMAMGYADIVVAAQFFNPSVAEMLLPMCGDFIDGLAVAPYVGRLQRPSDDFSSVTSEVIAEIDNDMAPLMHQYKSLADQYGIELMAYEGGLHQVARNDTDEEGFKRDKRLFADYNRSDDAAYVTEHLWQTWQAAGGGIACPYSLCTLFLNEWNGTYQNTFFGHCEIAGKEIKVLPKYDAAVALLGDVL